jgi:DNA polymerase-4
MGLLRELSPLVEPLSLDEAYVDLAAGGHDLSVGAVRALAGELRTAIRRRTALPSSVGVATSKLLAKVASDLDKPDGLVVVPPGDELAVLHPLPVDRLWGVGPVTTQRLHRLGATTVGELSRLPEDELVLALGQAAGRLLHRLASGDDDRPVVAERETKSIGVEETFASDLVDGPRLSGELDVLVARTVRRLVAAEHSGRTVTVKVRLHDFRTLSRSATLPAPTDDAAVLRRTARRLLAEVDVTGGVRLLGVAVSGLADDVQAELPDLLPAATSDGPTPAPVAPGTGDAEPAGRRYVPGADVEHAAYGRGWVQGVGAGRVTVRFETATTPPGPVRTFQLDDAALRAVEPLPPVGADAAGAPFGPDSTAVSSNPA